MSSRLGIHYAFTQWVNAGRTGPLNLSSLGLTELPPLPPDLTDLRCFDNALTELPPLPSGLRVLDAAENRLTELPPLPPTLMYLDVTGNCLTRLPDPLPAGLEQLYCSRNYLTDSGLPSEGRWPPSLHTFHCVRNRLRECPNPPEHVVRRLVGACWTFRPYLLRQLGTVCPCCDHPPGSFGPPNIKPF